MGDLVPTLAVSLRGIYFTIKLGQFLDHAKPADDISGKLSPLCRARVDVLMPLSYTDLKGERVDL